MTRLKKAFGKVCSTLLNHLLPDYTKRMIFVSSVAGSIAEVPKTLDEHNYPEVKLISEEINKLLNLSKYSDGIIAPMVVHSFIWHEDKDLNLSLPEQGKKYNHLNELRGEKLTPSQARIIANSLIDNAPAWMKYSSRNQIRKDLVTLLTNLENLACLKLTMATT